MNQDSASRLDGKVALVTGASKGIGEAMAAAYAAAGAAVMLSSRKQEALDAAADEIRRRHSGRARWPPSRPTRASPTRPQRVSPHRRAARPRRHPREQRRHQPPLRRRPSTSSSAVGQDVPGEPPRRPSCGPSSPGGPGCSEHGGGDREHVVGRRIPPRRRPRRLQHEQGGAHPPHQDPRCRAGTRCARQRASRPGSSRPTSPACCGKGCDEERRGAPRPLRHARRRRAGRPVPRRRRRRRGSPDTRW